MAARTSAHRWGTADGGVKVRVLAALFLILSILSPLVDWGTAAAAPSGGSSPDNGLSQTAPPPFNQPWAVSLGGDIANYYGSPVQLTAQAGGFWTGRIGLSPGTYRYSVIVSTQTGDVSVGKDGEPKPDAKDLELQMPDTAAEAFFSFNQYTGRTEAFPILAELQTDVGTFPMQPKDAGYTVTFDAAPGVYNVQTIIAGAPTGMTGQVQVDEGGRVTVEADSMGNITGTKAIQTARLFVTLADPNGAPLTDACFIAMDGRNPVAQSCDGNDGALDGTTLIRFQYGLPGGSVTIRQTAGPDGQPTASDQDTQLYPGDNYLTMTVAAPAAAEPPTEEAPTEAPQAAGLTLTVTSIDPNTGAPLPGACYKLNRQESCDADDGADDGNVLFTEVEPGDYDLKETTAPAGYEAPDGGTITISDNAQVNVPQVLPAAPTEVPTEAPQAGGLVIYKTDENGGSLAGSCFTLQSTGTGETVGACDGDDGSDDGTVQFSNLPAGTWNVTESQAPDGYTAGSPVSVDIAAGQVNSIQVTNTLASEPTPVPGFIAATTIDENGNEIPNTCYDISGGFGNQCDGDDPDNVMTQDEVAPGDYTVAVVPPDGYQVVGDQQKTVTVAAGETATVQFQVEPIPAEATDTPEGQPTAEPTAATESTGTGSLQVVATEEGFPIQGACVAVAGPVSGQFCDGDANDMDPSAGSILIMDIPTGDYTVGMPNPPAGFDPAGDHPVTVQDGQQAYLELVAGGGAAPTDQVGEVRIIKEDLSGNRLEGSCFTLNGASTIGPICDNADGDVDDRPGVLRFQGIPVGDWTLVESTAPAGYRAAADQAITVNAGETTKITVQDAPATGSLTVSKVDAGDGVTALTGACFSATSAATGETVAACDPDDGSDDGVTAFPALAAGTWTLTETQAPAGYAVAASVDVEVVAGADTPATVADSMALGSIRITKTDGTNPVAGSCFVVDASQPFCDNGSGDADPAEGVIWIQGVQPGGYTLTESTVPDGYVGADPQPIDVAAGDPTDITIVNTPAQPTEAPTTEAPTEEPTAAVAEASPTFAPEPDAGSVLVTKQDESGAALAGACFELSGATTVGPVCDDGAGDGDSTPGLILINDVVAGNYTLTETQAPDGFEIAASQAVAVEAGQQAAATVVDTAVPAATGALRIEAVDNTGAPLGGGCYRVAGLDACDNLAGADEDPAPGQILLTGLSVGAYSVIEVTAPSGYEAQPAQDVEIVPDAEAKVTFTYQALPPQTGAVTFDLRNGDGAAIDGGCVTIRQAIIDSPEQTICDGGPDDADDTPGVIRLTGLPTGTWTVRQSSSKEVQVAGFEGVAPDPQEQAFSPRNFQVQADVETVVVIIIVDVPDEGILQVVKRANDTNELQTGACFKVEGNGSSIEICDNDGVDANSSDGILRWENLPSGSWTLTETTAPAGYELAAAQSVTISKGLVTTVTVKDLPLADQSGDLQITKVDDAGDPVTGSCFVISQGNAPVGGPVCDAADGSDDGTITVEGLAAGDYTVSETTTPTDYETALDQPVRIIAGQVAKLTVVNSPKPGALLISKVDANGGASLPDACFGLDRGDGIEFEICDNDGADADARSGYIRFTSVPAGDYTLIETMPPAGYAPAADISITISPNQTLAQTVQNAVEPPPAQVGSLVINKVDQGGAVLTGACFSLKQGSVTKYAQRCDWTDGQLDGTITFPSVGVGAYVLHETRKPSAAYQTAPDRNVTIAENQQTTTSVENRLKPGRILVKKVNQQNQPLQNACFTVTPGEGTAKCTDGTGTVLFENLPVGTYKVTEISAPNGYLKAPAVTNVVVEAALTRTVTIVDLKAPPPADSGSVRLIKFFCPTNTPGLQPTVFNSSNPNPQQLAQTANCTKGDATFKLTSNKDASITQLNTGTQGESQVILPAGVYTMTEPGTSLSTAVTVYVNQQTTVVAINYVVPPPPAPGKIRVFKYTCDPGFTGTYYVDYITNCGEASALTSGIPFRISGAAAGRKITGDMGAKGQTTFSQLPVGTYTLTEETGTLPGTNTIYAWCGLTPEGSELKAVGPNISFTLGSGQTEWCAFFNVPDDTTETTGTIVVNKYACDEALTKRPAGFDWKQECSLYAGGAKFGISMIENGQPVPKASGVTNPDGAVRFSGLLPGTYTLKEIGGEWCHAESDSVDAQGNIVVQAGKRSTIWIFNCVPTKQPPNTGAGSTSSPLVIPASEAVPVLPGRDMRRVE